MTELNIGLLGTWVVRRTQTELSKIVAYRKLEQRKMGRSKTVAYRKLEQSKMGRSKIVAYRKMEQSKMGRSKKELSKIVVYHKLE